MGCGLSSEATTGVSVPGNPEEALELALRKGDMPALETALQTPLNVNAPIKDDSGRDSSALHMATKMGSSRAIAILLRASANPNIVDEEGRSPLHWAALRDSPECVSVLCRGGANKDLQAKDGLTPLQCAIHEDANDAVHTLIQEGACINVKEGTNMEAPLVTAAKTNNVAAVNILLMADANPVGLLIPVSGDENIDFLTWATRNRYMSIEEKILQKYNEHKEENADPTEENQGETAAEGEAGEGGEENAEAPADGEANAEEGANEEAEAPAEGEAEEGSGETPAAEEGGEEGNAEEGGEGTPDEGEGAGDGGEGGEAEGEAADGAGEEAETTEAKGEDEETPP
ncbi:ankyrin repeat domain-containing protein 35-like isoform X2 [Palaemon carinicauda]|uniref:ankyrin repeat domain-containing protein 35-like isoform X2 n=1 Tax=Palaemon carinicauda TaxID=392227 RepID=UPI0035B5F5F9